MYILRRPLFLAAAALFLASLIFFYKVNIADSLTSLRLDEETLGEICVNQVLVAAEISGSTADSNGSTDEEENADTGEATDLEDEEETVEVTGDPQVIIYHTHSTESYMPYSESNYHRTEEEGTVRDVGDVLEAQLKKKGINVVHDKTVHDRPSYNQSYARSLETIQALVKKYPTAKYVIDLHRDAAASSAKEGKLVTIKGNKVAKYSLVVGQRNENYVELYAFAKKFNETAESMYKGFGGAIIEKKYNYNEFVSNQALLLEIGNNKNTIEETRASAKLLGNVLAKIIKENN